MDIIYVTKCTPQDGSDTIQETIATHRTQDMRRIVRKYARDYDCAVHQGTYHAILVPHNGARWRLLIGTC